MARREFSILIMFSDTYSELGRVYFKYWYTFVTSLTCMLYINYFCYVYALVYIIFLLIFVGLTGSLFPHKQEAAFSALRMGLGVGFIIGFVSALFLSIEVQYYIGMTFLLIIIVTSSILFFTTQTKEQLCPCCVSN